MSIGRSIVVTCNLLHKIKIWICFFFFAKFEEKTFSCRHAYEVVSQNFVLVDVVVGGDPPTEFQVA